MHDELATRLQAAFNARNMDTLHSLLADDATWGEDPESESFCHNRNDVIAHIKRLFDEGVQPTIVETMTRPRGIAVRLHVEWADPEHQRPELQIVHQAYLVSDGVVSEIHGHDDQDSALAAVSD
ncbi:MAG TPA: nuclear transport factor 2 family protein [Acidimicrobiia bacterium]|nr:nuclear transport factor 2 family protein [Acidimicrobiia bacterium]